MTSKIRTHRLLRTVVTIAILLSGNGLIAGCKTTDRIIDCAPGYHNSAGPDSDCVPNSPSPTPRTTQS